MPRRRLCAYLSVVALGSILSLSGVAVALGYVPSICLSVWSFPLALALAAAALLAVLLGFGTRVRA